jgi:hypothetical protein
MLLAALALFRRLQQTAFESIQRGRRVTWLRS